MRATRDLVAVLTVAALAYVLGGALELHEWFSSFAEHHESVQLDELVFVLLAIAVSSAWFSHRRWRGMIIETEKRRGIEQALRKSEERFALAVRGSKDGIWDWDLETRELYFSQGWKAMFGLSETAAGDLWLPRIHPQDFGRLTAAFAPLLDGSSDHFECEHRMLHADDTYRWVLARGVCLRDATGKPTRLAGSHADITERVEVLQTLAHSEERLRVLVENAADGIFVHDMMGTITDVNAAACSALGYRRDELVGRALTDIDAHLTPDRVRDIRLKLSSGALAVHETALRRKDGSMLPVEVRSVPFMWNGQPYVLGTSRDITQRKHDEEALRAANQRLEFMVENAGVGFWDWDLRANEAEYSASWRRQFGYDEDQFHGRSDEWWDILHPDDRLTVASSLRDVLRGATHYEAELRVRHADGTYRNVLSRAAVVRDEEGRPIRMLGAHIDITEQKRMEQALREAQASLQLATESAKVAIWQTDLRTLTIRFLSGWKRVLGRGDGEIPLAALWDLVHPDDRAKITSVMQEGLQGSAGAYETEERMLHADGSYRWVLSRGVLTRDEDEQQPRLLGADIDITERKDLEEHLRRSEEQYRHLVEDITDVIYMTDRNGRVTYMSPVAEHLFGYAPAEFLDRQLSDFVFPDDLPAVADSFRHAVSGHPQPSDHRIVTKWGEVRWVCNHTRTILEGNLIVGLLGVISDVTDQRAAEEALRERTAQLEAANDELEAFSYSVSHDLRVPLRHVEGFSQMLLEDCAHRLDDAGRSYVERIAAGCRRMGQLIEGLLALSHVGRRGVRYESVDLSAAAQEIVAALRQGQPDREVEVVIAPGLRAVGDPGLLRTVLENLLGNAWKYTARKARGQIELGHQERAGETIFFVRDNGAGFDPAQAQKLFAPFQRLHGASEFEGMGIGLSVVQRVIHRHRGRVWATAAVDEGATFYFTLPKVPAASAV